MQRHIKRTLTLLLALVLCLGLLPGAALADEGGGAANPGAANPGTYELLLNPNGGALPAGAGGTVALDVTDPAAPTLRQELPTPTRAGCVFLGWYQDGSSDPVKVGDVFGARQTTLTAKWSNPRPVKTAPALTASPDKIEAGTKKVELALSCTTAGVVLDWRPLERLVAPAGGSNLESAVRGLITGNFSVAGLELTGIRYEDSGVGSVNEDAYPTQFYPQGICPASTLVLTLEGEAKTGSLVIELAGGNFLKFVPQGDNNVLEAASADLFDAAQVKIPVSDPHPNGPFTVKFDLNYKDPPEAEIPKDQTVSMGTPVDLPDGSKLTCPFISHEFFAWCMKGEDGKLYPWKASNPVNGDMTLYAGWIKKGTVVKDGQALPDTSSQTVQQPAKPAQPAAPAKTAFTDVVSTSPFAPAISWAVEKKITNGKTATTFGPGDPCTRAQIVTFLWRAAGSPEPKLTETQYMDVTDPNAYYYKAVQWAAEMDMEYAGTFDPHKTCDRASAVYFIWKAFGSPKASAKSSFADMPEKPVNGGQWYWPDLLDAVDWAVGQGVTTGKTADTFAPGDPCTRGHIVTFLYRAYVK